MLPTLDLTPENIKINDTSEVVVKVNSMLKKIENYANSFSASDAAQAKIEKLINYTPNLLRGNGSFLNPDGSFDNVVVANVFATYNGSTFNGPTLEGVADPESETWGRGGSAIAMSEPAIAFAEAMGLERSIIFPKFGVIQIEVGSLTNGDAYTENGVDHYRILNTSRANTFTARGSYALSFWFRSVDYPMYIRKPSNTIFNIYVDEFNIEEGANEYYKLDIGKVYHICLIYKSTNDNGILQSNAMELVGAAGTKCNLANMRMSPYPVQLKRNSMLVPTTIGDIDYYLASL